MTDIFAHSLEILDPSGHLTLSWDPDDEATVRLARETFDRLKAAGYAFFATPETKTEIKSLKPAAFARASGLDVRLVRDFQPRARRTLAVRPMQGG